MYWLDTTILAVLGIGAVFGAISGLLMQLARLVGFGLALYAAVYFNDEAAALLQQHFMQDAEPLAARLVAYAAVFILVYLAIFLVSLLLERGLKGMRLQALNRVLGAALGACKAGLLLGAVFMGLGLLPNASTREMMQRSTLAPVLARGVETLLTALEAEYREELRGGLQEFSKALRPQLAGAVAEGLEEPAP